MWKTAKNNDSLMQWKSCFCVIFIALPFLSLAQQDANKVTTDGRQLALLDENIKPEQVVIQPGTKVVTPDTLVIRSQKPIATATSTVADRSASSDSVAAVINYKPVPLIGQLAYYGEKNDYLINYCTSYINNFGRRLASVRDKEQTFKTIESILAKHQIPKELEYLAVIESALNANARSPVGAVGYWQFMAGTARHVGLTVNRYRDDRRNLYKSTEAAAKYLSYLYDRLDDWLLVVAAYNCGAGRLEEAVKRAGGKKDFWAIKSFLPKETQNHVLAFVATATIMERLSEYIEPGLPDNFDWSSLNYSNNPSEIKGKNNSGKFEHPLVQKFGIEEVKKMAIISINKPLSLQVLASVLDVDARTIGRWNYDFYEYKENYKTGQTYNLRIPKNKLDDFLSQRNYIQSASDKMAN